MGRRRLPSRPTAGWVAYTGDLRLHGLHGAQTQEAVAALAALKPTVLLCEGTRGAESAPTSEQDVYETAAEIVRQASGKLVFADFGPRNVERLLIFHKIAQETDRRLAVLNKDAYLLEAMHFAAPDEVPDFGTAPNFALYQKGRSRVSGWEKKLLERVITPCSWMRKRCATVPGSYILCFSFWDINELASIAPVPAVYIYSSSEAFNEEMAIDHQRLGHWLDTSAWSLTVWAKRRTAPCTPRPRQRHELLDIIRQIRPQRLVPSTRKTPATSRGNWLATTLRWFFPRATAPSTSRRLSELLVQ